MSNTWSSDSKNSFYNATFSAGYTGGVDVFISIDKEPVDVVEATLYAALEMDYPNFQVFVLNNLLLEETVLTKKIEQMTDRVGGVYLNMAISKDLKTDKINHALANSSNPYVVIFDANNIPHKDFLRKTIGYFIDDKVGFVRSRIHLGKNKLNSILLAGTNTVFRRESVMQVGGISQSNAAKYLVTLLSIYQKGWKSVYVQEMLSERV